MVVAEGNHLLVMLSNVITPRITTRFILTNTLHNDNIGSSARAIKTMGFAHMTLVSPRDTKVLLDCKKTKHRASGADDVLKQANIYTSLDDAIEGCDLVCGTGMPIDMHRKRKHRRYVEPRIYFEMLLNDIREKQGMNLDIGFVFGCETTGMSEMEMDRCHVMLGIPSNPMFGSLNLANAVQIIAYDWRIALGGTASYD